MKTYTLEEKKQIFTRWHIGRGGQYFNAGHLTFCGCEDFHGLVDKVIELGATLITEDYNEKTDKYEPRKDEDWELYDSGGNVVLQGREYIDRETGTIDFDGEYDTDYVKTVDELGKKEELLLCKAINTSKYVDMTDELREYIENELIPYYESTNEL